MRPCTGTVPPVDADPAQAWVGCVCRFAIAVALRLSLTGCTDVIANGVVSIPLVATSRNAGEIGRAFLVPLGAETGVTVELSGAPPQVVSRPVHLYTFLYDGRCDALPAKPVQALTERVLAQSVTGAAPIGGPFTISNTAPLPLAVLRHAHYAIVVRTSPADGDVAIFCGNIQ